MDLVQALGVRRREIVTIIGGGGKTSLMFALARDLVATGCRVVTTTTTKMLKPPPSQSGVQVLERDEGALRRRVAERIMTEPHLTVGLEGEGERLLAVSEALVHDVSHVDRVDCVVVEGDGSRHRHLKAPREGEPVIPSRTALVVPVIGIDVVGKTFTEETIFRPEIVERITPHRRGDEITLDMVYDVLFHEEGILSRCPPGARIVLFVSFVDGPRELAHARDLAVRALRARPFGIRRVVLGNADPGRVLEVLSDRGGSASRA